MTTKNGDMPAMPCGETKQAGDISITTTANAGLSKREMMSMHVLAGVIASGYDTTCEQTAMSAVRYTDALLAELERTK